MRRRLRAASYRANQANINWGMLSALDEMRREAEGKAGMAYVVRRLGYLNCLYCWGAGTKESHWPPVNRHLWRIQALYCGGDCFLAGWPGAAPHQALWRYRQPRRWQEEAKAA